MPGVQIGLGIEMLSSTAACSAVGGMVDCGNGENCNCSICHWGRPNVVFGRSLVRCTMVLPVPDFAPAKRQADIVRCCRHIEIRKRCSNCRISLKHFRPWQITRRECRFSACDGRERDGSIHQLPRSSAIRQQNCDIRDNGG